MTREPAACGSMAEVRAEIDRLDRVLVALLARRAGYIDRAVAVKRAQGLPARIEARVDEVIGNARARAAADGLDPALAEDLWRRIVEWSIAREERALADDRR
jgi:isochorismate pyruvate lyase